jgi:hypothetical protein
MAFPDERVAVVVLTNQDSVDTSAALSLLPHHGHNVTKWHRQQNRCGYTKKQLRCGQRLHVGHECLSLDLGSSAPRSGGG